MFGIDDLLGGLVGGGFKMLANAQQNQANSRQMEDQQAFNAQQADISRQFSAGQQLQSESYNANQADLNRQFQQQMSSTAYQRATADMKAAGLNPILAYQQGGASSPAGSSASVGMASGASASSPSAPPRAALMSDVVSSALEGARLKPTIDKAKADAAVSESTDAYVKQNTAARLAEERKVQQETATERERTKSVAKDAALKQAQTEAAIGQRSKVGGVDTDYLGNKIWQGADAFNKSVDRLVVHAGSTAKSIFDMVTGAER